MIRLSYYIDQLVYAALAEAISERFTIMYDVNEI